MLKCFKKPKRLVANTETLTERFGQFTAQPFERGFGSTIGTGLRRVLLSSIEGAAITGGRLKGEQPGQVLSGQIETDPDVEVLDRNLPIATIGEGGKLSIEMRLKSG